LTKQETVFMLLMRQRWDKGFLLPQKGQIRPVGYYLPLLVVVANNQLLRVADWALN
jgi:hypothetical protein